jgi:hypothetical protein
VEIKGVFCGVLVTKRPDYGQLQYRIIHSHFHFTAVVDIGENYNIKEMSCDIRELFNHKTED